MLRIRKGVEFPTHLGKPGLQNAETDSCNLIQSLKCLLVRGKPLLDFPIRRPMARSSVWTIESSSRKRKR